GRGEGGGGAGAGGGGRGGPGGGGGAGGGGGGPPRGRGRGGEPLRGGREFELAHGAAVDHRVRDARHREQAGAQRPGGKVAQLERRDAGVAAHADREDRAQHRGERRHRGLGPGREQRRGERDAFD